MTGIETALVKVGQAVVTPFVTRWLAGRRETRERTLPLSDLLRQRSTDEFTRRRGERQIEAVVDDVAERLKPLVATQFAVLPANETEAALEAVADTFLRADLSDDALFTTDLDPARLVAHLRRSAPPAALSDLAQRLYDVALADCARCYVQFVVRAAPFGNRAAVEMLGRLTDLTDMMSETLRQLALLSTGAMDEDEFLARYYEALTRKLNVLDLVGLDTQFRPRTTLNVAYISLSVSGDGPAARRRAAAWDPSLVRHARLEDAGAERVEQALGRCTRALIRGEAGAGKSTLLRWLAVTAAARAFTGDLAEWNGRVPFLIKLRSWPTKLPAPEQFLTGVADPIAGTMPRGWVHRRLESGALLLVDGVDELPAERRPAVRAWIKDLLDMFPSAAAVVTSRPPAAPVRWLQDEADFVTLTLERLAPNDVFALIEQWHKAARTAPSLPCLPSELHRYHQSLLGQLAANRHLYRLAGNPLMAAMLCALNLDRETHLPPDRMGIYQAAVDMLLHRRDTERSVHSAMPEMSVRERRQLLQDLAWRISLNNRSELSRADALAYVARRLDGMPRVTADPAAVLTHLLERSGVLREPAVGRIDFVHRTFQEYLAALEAAEQDMGGMLANHYAHLDTWREIVVMAAGHGHSAMRSELIDGLLSRAEREPQHRRTLVLLAAACLETVPSLEPPELLARVNRELDTLLPPRSRSEAQRLHAVGEPLLGRLPSDLSGLSTSRAAAVVQAVALINGPRALELLAAYASDSRYEVQRELVNAWSYFDPEEYAQRVLADAPLPAGHVNINHVALLGSVRHLRNLVSASLFLMGRVSLADLPACPQLESIYLIGGADGSLSELDKFPNLTTLYWNEGITPTGIASLAALPKLTSLSLLANSAAEALDKIGQCGGLTELTISLNDEVNGIDALAGLSRLRTFAVLSGQVRSFHPLAEAPITDFTYGCSRPPRRGSADLVDSFPVVEGLSIFGGPDWPRRLDFVDRFERLERLALHHIRPRSLAGLTLPPRLRAIRLYQETTADLAPLVDHIQLTQLTVDGPGPDTDISCFTNWRGGRLTIEIDKRATIPAGLPPSVRLRRR
ncbi:NACHT domain-containing protein [Actinoplanes sp. KI2]|uniref:NACHT domain-containing protein n=1 Tax=Actinoplanes sp. KI2 TaxID=2983315 RepID=UPI0021D56D13|nr:NACHT domain-containing protein [Actinoplanes sp. KI2]MCU7724853.1 NACHT domain-containing protein [Actinoplanes sp. KI2]